MSFSAIIANLLGGVLQSDELATNRHIMQHQIHNTWGSSRASFPIYYLLSPLEQTNHLFCSAKMFQYLIACLRDWKCLPANGIKMYEMQMKW